jgi:hypothetical protein
MKPLHISLALLLSSTAFLGACKPRVFQNSSGDEASPLAWDVKATGWTPADEQGFSDYVAKIGAARASKKCSTVQECVAKVPPANLAPEATPALGTIDCGRLPFLLRAYYAYRMRLPFAFHRVDNSSLEGRYTPTGNNVIGHRDQASVETVASFFKSAVGAYFTAYYRVPTDANPKAANAFADTYPVAINRLGIRPGTVYYDVAGHVAIVTAVKEDGSIVTWNGHPDGTNTIRSFTESNFPNLPSGKRKLGGFLRFRSWTAVGNAADKKAIPNPQQEAFSLEQYQQPWVAEKTDFYGYVAKKLGAGGKSNPLEMFALRVEELCTIMNDRTPIIREAHFIGLFKQPHPGLPRNIFQAADPWEKYSTPSADMRAKMGFQALHALVRDSLAAAAAQNTALYSFQGTAADLAKAYMAKWNLLKSSPECTATSVNSAGAPLKISVEQAMQNAFDWSFDPYHCPELRWGFQGTKTCITDAAKLDIYAKEAKLRWNTVKNSEVQTGFDYGNNSARPDTNFLPILATYLK